MAAAIEDKELLWCLLCNDRYTTADVGLGFYYGETGICRKCYAKMQKDERTCFGKAEFYDEKTLECGQYCPDKRVCPVFIAFPKR